jgi:uncharacterized membrane protein (UPF0127 family)
MLVGAVAGTLVFIALVVFIAHPMSDLNNYGSTVEFEGYNHTAVTVQVDVADTDPEWEYGLMNRTSMAQDHGMLFVFDDERMRSFWMKDTLIPLDMVFLDSSGQIVDINKNATPLSETVFAARSPSKYVVEINGGFCDLYGIRIGDTVTINIVKE